LQAMRQLVDANAEANAAEESPYVAP
jgi:hypothetical protein